MFSAEAISQTLFNLRKVSEKYICVLSDSLSALQTIKSCNISTNSIVADKIMNNFKQHKKVLLFFYIKKALDTNIHKGNFLVGISQFTEIDIVGN